LTGKLLFATLEPWTSSTASNGQRLLLGLSRFGFEVLEAALASAGKRVVVVEEGEVTDDLARDLLEILTAACGRLYGRRWARNRARRALEAMGCA